MVTATFPAKMPPMVNQGSSRAERGERLKAWQESTGIEVTRLARHAGLSTQSVYNAFVGKAGENTYTKLEAARDYITEHPHDEPDEPQAVVSTESGIIEVELTDVYGVGRIAVRGPVGNAAEMEEFVRRVLGHLQHGQGEATDK